MYDSIRKELIREYRWRMFVWAWRIVE